MSWQIFDEAKDEITGEWDNLKPGKFSGSGPPTTLLVCDEQRHVRHLQTDMCYIMRHGMPVWLGLFF